MSVDLLSVLPEALIFLILSFLGMREVVKTTLLSKAWKDLWTFIPFLDFDETKKSVVQTRNFIHEVFHRWRGTKILRFKISFGEVYDASLCEDVDDWVAFAAKKNVQELYLEQMAYNFRNPDPVHFLPQCIYSCSSLTKLKLIGFRFRVHDVQWDWDQLESLLIIGHCISEDFVNQLVASCPKLEILEAYLSGSHQTLDVRSSGLRKLALTTGLHDPSDCTALTIWAPNLEALAVSGQYSRCLLANVPSLARMSLYFRDSCVVRVEAMLRQVLPAIQQVEELWLSLSLLKMLGVMKGKYSVPNVKILKLRGGPIEPNDVVSITELFPNVEKLLIVWRYDYWYTLFLENLTHKYDIGEKNYLELAEAKNLKALLMQLRILDLRWITSDAPAIHLIFEFIKLALKHAAMLQQIVITKTVNNVVQLEAPVLAEQQVLILRRSFPSVDIIFC